MANNVLQSSGWITDISKSTKELTTGDYLHIYVFDTFLPATHYGPEEHKPLEYTLVLNAKPISREGLPSEITDEVIGELIASAKPCPEWDFHRFNS